jgi:hypothetical protein
MDMSFQHQRRRTTAGLQKADYASLVASATAVQATSLTVRALLSTPRERVNEIDALESRMNFFAKRGGSTTRRTRGAFLPTNHSITVATAAKSETCVNLSGSVSGKDVELGFVQPEVQVAERGTEF